MKDKLGKKIMRDFVVVRPEKYSYLIDHNDENKKSKRHKKVCYKKKA